MALPDTFHLTAKTARTSGFAAATIATTATLDGSAIDNADAANLDLFLSAEFVWSYATAPTANKNIEVYLQYAQDGTNYEENSPHSLIGGFSPAADTSTHRRMILKQVPLLPLACKLSIKNVDTAQTITVTVNAIVHNEKVVD